MVDGAPVAEARYSAVNRPIQQRPRMQRARAVRGAVLVDEALDEAAIQPQLRRRRCPLRESRV